VKKIEVTKSGLDKPVQSADTCPLNGRPEPQTKIERDLAAKTLTKQYSHYSVTCTQIEAENNII
jgi:hypothetical protein